MTYNVSSGTLNPTHSLTHMAESITDWLLEMQYDAVVSVRGQFMCLAGRWSGSYYKAYCAVEIVTATAYNQTTCHSRRIISRCLNAHSDAQCTQRHVTQTHSPVSLSERILPFHFRTPTRPAPGVARLLVAQRWYSGASLYSEAKASQRAVGSTLHQVTDVTMLVAKGSVTVAAMPTRRRYSVRISQLAAEMPLLRHRHHKYDFHVCNWLHSVARNSCTYCATDCCNDCIDQLRRLYSDDHMITVCAQHTARLRHITPSTPAVPNCYCLKRSAPYGSNPPVLIFDIRALWRSVLRARAPECRKLKLVG